MVNNYPMYAAGVSFQKADESENRHFYNAQVVVDPSDDSMSAKLTKDGEVISELPDGGGGSSDLNNPIELELIDDNNKLVTKLTEQEIYNLCLTGTPYFTVTAEQVETYGNNYKPDTKYFINEYYTAEELGQSSYGFFFAMLGIVDTSIVTVEIKLDALDPNSGDHHLIIAGGL